MSAADKYDDCMYFVDLPCEVSFRGCRLAWHLASRAQNYYSKSYVHSSPSDAMAAE